MSEYDPPLKTGGDSELQEFLMVEKEKAQVTAQVRNIYHSLVPYMNREHNQKKMM